MNNSDSCVGIFILGICTGVIISAISLIFIPGTTFQKGLSVIENCEKTLPRDQHCILSAIPEPQK